MSKITFFSVQYFSFVCRFLEENVLAVYGSQPIVGFAFANWVDTFRKGNLDLVVGCCCAIPLHSVKLHPRPNDDPFEDKSDPILRAPQLYSISKCEATSFDSGDVLVCTRIVIASLLCKSFINMMSKIWIFFRVIRDLKLLRGESSLCCESRRILCSRPVR